MERMFIITGAYGHLGNTIVKSLLDQGENVRCFVMEADISKALEGLNVEIVTGDVCNKESINKLFEGLEDFEKIVIHTAGIVSIASKFDEIVYNVNVLGTQNIIDKCKEYNVRRLVYISSVHAIEEAKDRKVITETNKFDENLVHGLYAQTKAEATRRVLEASKEGLDCVVIHPSGIIGPNDYGKGHSTQLVMDFLDGRLTAGTAGGYDFVDVRDVTEGIIKAANIAENGECYLLSNKYYSVMELTNLLADISGKKKIKTILPTWFVNLTAPLAEAWYKMIKQTPLYTKYSVFTLSSNSNFSHEKAIRELGYKTRDMQDTLKDTIKFLEDNGRIKFRMK